MKEVWLLQYGEPYEGWSTIGAFSSFERALAALKARREEYPNEYLRIDHFEVDDGV